MKNNQSTIINLSDSNKKGTHWVAFKRNNNKIFYFDSFGVPFLPDVIKNQYNNLEIICNIYRIQHVTSNECGRFCILFIKANIKNEDDYMKFLLKFEKNDFIKNDI